jgi:hydroxymethylbilane synthase
VLVFFGHAESFAALPAGERVGTSSLRRRALLLGERSDLEVVELRGNVRTRLGAAAERGLGAAVLARAGLERLGLGARVGEVLDPHRFVPQAGQGALAVTCRSGDSLATELGDLLDDGPTRTALRAERAYLSRLGGGCQVPAGAYAEVTGDTVALRAVLLSPDGRTCMRSLREVPSAEAERAGVETAATFLDAGGEEVIRALREGGGG